MPAAINLNPEQQLAVERMMAHLSAPKLTITQPIEDAFLVLEGPAGTGKTFCLKQVVADFRGRMVFTAPTNKAVKVIRDMLKSDDHKPDCRTIFSLLGLALQANGEVKELSAPEDPIDLSDVRLVVIDEGSMVGAALWQHILEAAQSHPRIRWIIMGDRWQLPPIGEDMSAVWTLPHRVELTQIMRTDNTILQLSAQVRALIQTPFKPLVLAKTEDVNPLAATDFEWMLQQEAQSFLLGEAKAVAWRNVTVDRFNALIRAKLFADAASVTWQIGDRITVTEPVKDLEGKMIATTDDEGVVEAVSIVEHPIYSEFFVWAIAMRTDENKLVNLFALHNRSKSTHFNRLERLRTQARAVPRLWREFWEFKDAFAAARHAYATTAHRSQGSTYRRAFVNWRDIMRNDNRSEAYRCLYVGVTRPQKELYLG